MCDLLERTDESEDSEYCQSVWNVLWLQMRGKMSNSEKDLSFHLCLRFFSLSSKEVEYNCGLVAVKQPQNCQKNVKNFANHASP